MAKISGELLFGRQPVLEALKAGRRTFYRLAVAQDARDADILKEIVACAEQLQIPTKKMPLQAIDAIVGSGHHQGVALEAGPYPYIEMDDLNLAPESVPLLLLLDHVQDPQNLGALLRSADAAGVRGVIIPKDRAAEVTPAAARASAGAAEHVTVCRVVNLHQAMLKLKEEGIWLMGLEGLPSAALYTTVDMSGPVGLVVGSEGQGLSRLIRDTCDHLIRLPMLGKIGSLNASVAGAVALYEILRQRKGLK